MMTSKFSFKELPGRGGRLITKVGRKEVEHLKGLRIPPAWTGVQVDPDPGAKCVAMGYDEKGRLQRLYSEDHKNGAKEGKFERVRMLLGERDAIGDQLWLDLNPNRVKGKNREAAFVAGLIFHTGIRPGSTTDTLADVEAFGATTLQLRHVKPCPRGVRLQFVGKKGVAQNVLVTDEDLVEEMLARKAAGKPRQRLFNVSSTKVNEYISTLGSGQYTAKDFRTALGTKLALELLGGRKRLPKAKAKRRKIVNDALDKVAKLLGNTRAVSRSSYVDPGVIERFLE